MRLALNRLHWKPRIMNDEPTGKDWIDCPSKTDSYYKSMKSHIKHCLQTASNPNLLINGHILIQKRFDKPANVLFDMIFNESMSNVYWEAHRQRESKGIHSFLLNGESESQVLTHIYTKRFELPHSK